MWRLIWLIIGFSVFFWLIDLPNNKTYKERGLKGAVEEVWYGKTPQQSTEVEPTAQSKKQSEPVKKAEEPPVRDKDKTEFQGNY